SPDGSSTSWPRRRPASSGWPCARVSCGRSPSTLKTSREWLPLHDRRMSIEHIVEGLERREPAALARAISLVENQRDGFERLLSHVHARLGQGGTRRIGITGPPGAGKSTLAELLIQQFRAQGLGVGVVAVDPTSPFTGGALLGDRIRMESASLDPRVFIRSMATRGAHGGLATTTAEVADLLEAFGFERVLIETVGVGQTELDVARTAESTVLATIASQGDGVAELVAALDRHYLHLQQSGKLVARRRQRLAERTRAALARAVHQWIAEDTRAEELLARRLDEVADGRRSPYDVAAEILDQVRTEAPR